MAEICLTGFKAAKKAELKMIALDSGLIVRVNVTKNLDYLICGENAGKAKIARAKTQTVCLLIGERGLFEVVRKHSHFE